VHADAEKAASSVRVEERLSHPLSEVETFMNGMASPAFASRATYHENEYRWGDGSAEILDYLLVAEGRVDPPNLTADEEAELYVKVRFRDAVPTPVFGFYIKTIEGLMVTGCNSRDFGEGWGGRYRSVAAGETVICRFRFRPHFESANYLLSIGVAADNGGELSPMDRRYDSILVKIESREPYYGLVGIDAQCDFINARI
jgi:lipopolysaccharide transport system ATP-binding protein